LKIGQHLAKLVPVFNLLTRYIHTPSRHRQRCQ